MKKRDEFNISDGNLRILELIPQMMKKDKWRNKLRLLTVSYLSEDVYNNLTKIEKLENKDDEDDYFKEAIV